VRTIGGGPTIYGRILLGNTKARDSMWTVPAGKTLYITSVVMSAGAAASGKNVVMTLRATYDDDDAHILTPGAFFMPFFETMVQDGTFLRTLEIPVKMPATVDLKISAFSGSAGAVCVSVCRGFLMNA
jgi:hypothetical protein